MSSKTVSIDEEAYEQLKTRKKEGESFSDVVKRLAGEQSWNEVTGILTESEADELEASITAGRSASNRRSDQLADELADATDETTE
jgi:Uncharacterized ACR, COG1753.